MRVANAGASIYAVMKALSQPLDPTRDALTSVPVGTPSDHRTMNTRTRRYTLSALSVASAVILAACGGGDATPPPETQPPTINVVSSVPGTATGAVTFTFTFSEDVGSSFTADDVTVSNGSKGTFTRLGELQYSLVVNPAANAAGTMALSIAAGSYADLVGNPGVAAAATQAFDTMPPIVTIASSAAGTTATGDVVFSFAFSKDVGSSFTADDVSLSTGTKGAFAMSGGTGATLVVTPPANAAGTIEVTVPVMAVTDSAGTANAAAASLAQAFDTAVPVVATTIPPTPPTRWRRSSSRLAPSCGPAPRCRSAPTWRWSSCPSAKPTSR